MTMRAVAPNVLAGGVSSVTGTPPVASSGGTTPAISIDPLFTIPRAAAGGTADAITATFSPALTLANMTLCIVIAGAANATATPTFAPNGLAAHTITKYGGQALVAGDIFGALMACILCYNLANTRWELLNPVN